MSVSVVDVWRFMRRYKFDDVMFWHGGDLVRVVTKVFRGDDTGKLVVSRNGENVVTLSVSGCMGKEPEFKVEGVIDGSVVDGIMKFLEKEKERFCNVGKWTGRQTT